MKILILVEEYPSSASISGAFVHSRVKEYIRRGLNVTVLSFKTEVDYVFEKVEIISSASFKNTRSLSGYDLVISHAPNLRHHMKFIIERLASIKHVIFYIHGHEVLQKSAYYPRPYSFQKTNYIKSYLIQDIYDSVKRRILKLIFKSLIKKQKASLVFVSNWMLQETLKNLNLEESDLRGKFEIIPNPVNKVFAENKYVPQNEFKADFITIRSLDVPKYGIDVLVEACKKFPQFRFDLYGKGEYFQHNTKPMNLNLINHNLSQSEIPQLLNQYKYAFMPTKLDAQGVMTCEIAMTGMPVFSSDHKACQEFLKGLKNVSFFSNDTLNIEEGLKNIQTDIPKRLIETLHPDVITNKELELFQRVSK